MKKKVVVALGHRALGNNLPDQWIAVQKTAKSLADLIEAGYELVITHSNAPQLGMIHTAMNEFGVKHDEYTAAPMSVCSAMSQGYIGFDLQAALRQELIARGIFRTISTVITQVTVDPYDEAFYEPSKIVGRYLTKEEAEQEEAKGNHVVEEPGKGFRRIVAAPKPVDIVELDAIRVLVENDQVVIACGGGGIPVMEQNHILKGASAVIEKDYTAGLLAEKLDADELIILTSVENVSLNHGTNEEELIRTVDTKTAERYIAEGHFGEKSMLPKMEAAVHFVSGREGRRAIITSFEKLKDGIKERTGTIIK
jgi:carbamate kinase